MAGSGAATVAASQCVIIVGRHSLQNKLMANLIDEGVGCPCLIKPPDGMNGLPDSGHVLMMLDAEDGTPDAILAHLQALSVNGSCRSIAIFNANEEDALEKVVAWPKVKGLFYRQTSGEHLVRGIRAIFNDECWVPRKMLSAYLEQTRASRPPKAASSTLLTRKEIETLKLLAGGNSNSHIARTLNVSPHTVKTHIYNLFRKIHVSNRVQAVSWALNNVDGIEKEFRR